MNMKKLIQLLKDHGVEYYISLYQVIACFHSINEQGEDIKEWEDLTGISSKNLYLWLGYDLE
jgi:hypothetical protein